MGIGEFVNIAYTCAEINGAEAFFCLSHENNNYVLLQTTSVESSGGNLYKGRTGKLQKRIMPPLGKTARLERL